MSKKLLLFNLVFYCVLATAGVPLHAAYVYHLEAFTDNGCYHDSGDLDLYVVVSDPQPGQVDFTFHNASLIDSSVARIYFDDSSFLDIAGITEGLGTSFSQPATPGNLPGGKTLEPPFVAADEFSFKGGPPGPKNGVNPGEWLTITFDINGGSFVELIDYLDAGALRIGAHVIALPDGSSESVVTVPEPATVALLGMGALCLLRKRRPKAKNQVL
ncbi:MAG: PEP-CTERM sorting domain-containing protein [Planctomycetota bacterium]|nr:MAG: PEP-CTERM sorting domain-containing protein [Planctomycetota bacterium]